MKKGSGEKKRFYQSNWFMWACLILLPPVGLVILWLFHQEKRIVPKVILTVVFSIWSIPFIAAMLSGPSESVADTPHESEEVYQMVTPTLTEGPVYTEEPTATPSALPTAELSVSPEATPQESEMIIQTQDPEQPSPTQIPPEQQETKITPPVVDQAPPQTSPPPEPEETEDVSPIENEQGEQQSEVSQEVEPGNGGGSGNGNGENFNTYDNTSQQQTADTYVLNTNTMKFHKPSCSSVKKIAPENYDTSSQTRDELIDEGYTPCGICHP